MPSTYPGFPLSNYSIPSPFFSAPATCSPLQSPHRDLALMVAALAYNQWFTKLYCKDLRLVGTWGGGGGGDGRGKEQCSLWLLIVVTPSVLRALKC